MAKVSAAEGLEPRPMEVESKDGSPSGSSEGFGLKKELGLLNGVAIIVGVIVGSGIFVSPKNALEDAGSKLTALIIWILSGLLSLVGALCYAELGTMIPKSGGDYAYIGDVYGSLPAFLYLWVSLFILVPTGNAITALTFAKNILKPNWIACDPPSLAVKLLAALVICTLTLINCYKVKWVTQLQNYFTIAKILFFVVTFIASFTHLLSGHTENLPSLSTFEGTKWDAGDLAIAFYASLFSYSGWNYLNFVTEELKDPFKNLPRAIMISMPVVALVYVFTNLSFFVVLSNEEILMTEEVAVTFGEKMLGSVAWIMPLFVALCTIGSLNGAIYASSRLFFVGARNGHLPMAIALIDVKRRTPVPSLIFMCLVTLVLLVLADVKTLIVYVSSVEALCTLCSVSGLLWLRYTDPNRQRPIKISLFWPIIFFIIVSILVIASITKKPYEIGYGILFIVIGIPVYFIFITWINKFKWLQSAGTNFNMLCSKLFLCLPENSKDL